MSSQEDRDTTVYEPEVLPPEKKSGEGGGGAEATWRKWTRSFGPIVLGLLIDLLDFATFGPVGLRSGFLIGGLAAYAICSMYGLPLRYRLLCALAAAVYCMFPATERFPLATILGVYARYAGGQGEG
jgi:hypothetical protein